MKQLTLLLVLMLLGCQDSSSSGTGQIHPGAIAPTGSPTATTVPTNPVDPDDTYVYLFHDFYNGGVKVGDKTNLLFAVDMQQKTQILTPPPNFSKGAITPKIKTKFEYGNYCVPPWETPLVTTDIVTGETSWIDTLELTMTSISHLSGSPPEEDNWNEMCYGYRTNGAWVWKLEARRATWNADTKKYVMNFQINAGPIDAVKVLFNNGFGASRYLEKMVLVARPTP